MLFRVPDLFLLYDIGIFAIFCFFNDGLNMMKTVWTGVLVALCTSIEFKIRIRTMTFAAKVAPPTALSWPPGAPRQDVAIAALCLYLCLQFLWSIEVGDEAIIKIKFNIFQLCFLFKLMDF